MHQLSQTTHSGYRRQRQQLTRRGEGKSARGGERIVGRGKGVRLGIEGVGLGSACSLLEPLCS